VPAGGRGGGFGAAWAGSGCDQLSPLPIHAHLLIVVHEVSVDCEQRQLQTVRDANFVEDAGKVVLDRVLAQREIVRDLLVCGARGDDADDLQLAGVRPYGASTRRGVGREGFTCT